MRCKFSLLEVHNVQLPTNSKLFFIFFPSFYRQRGCKFWDKIGILSFCHSLFRHHMIGARTVRHDNIWSHERFVMMTLWMASGSSWWNFGSGMVWRKSGLVCVHFRRDPRIFEFNACLFNINSLVLIGLLMFDIPFVTSHYGCKVDLLLM